MRDLLGGKGAGVAEMTRAGLPVPPGFTITTQACNAFYESGQRFPEGMWDQVLRALKETERKTGKTFGDARNPLLVSVRSGAKFSMPGMMDTVLNLGLNAETLQGPRQAHRHKRSPRTPIAGSCSCSARSSSASMVISSSASSRLSRPRPRRARMPTSRQGAR